MTQWVGASSTGLDPNVSKTSLFSEHVDDVLQQDVDVDALPGEGQAASRDPCDIEQVVDQPDLEIEIPPHGLQRGVQRFGGERDQLAVGHCRHDGRERRAQLVTQRGEKKILRVGAGAPELAIAREPIAGLLGLAALLFEPLPLGDVDDRRQEGRCALVSADLSSGHELNMQVRTARVEREFDGGTRAIDLTAVPQVLGKARLVGHRDERVERQTDDRAPLVPQQRGAREVHFANHSAGGDRHVADRCEVVQIDVAIARLLEGMLRFDQLAVLGAELLLMDLQLVE